MAPGPIVRFVHALSVARSIEFDGVRAVVSEQFAGDLQAAVAAASGVVSAPEPESACAPRADNYMGVLFGLRVFVDDRQCWALLLEDLNGGGLLPGEPTPDEIEQLRAQLEQLHHLWPADQS